jgi:hypothetical protein
MPVRLNVSGTWKKVSMVWKNVNGVWKQVATPWLNVSGTWKRVVAQDNVEYYLNYPETFIWTVLSGNQAYIYWEGEYVGNTSEFATSIYFNGKTYYRGTYRESYFSSSYYGVYRN